MHRFEPGRASALRGGSGQHIFNQETIYNGYPLAKGELVISNKMSLGVLTTLRSRVQAQE